MFYRVIAPPIDKINPENREMINKWFLTSKNDMPSTEKIRYTEHKLFEKLKAFRIGHPPLKIGHPPLKIGHGRPEDLFVVQGSVVSIKESGEKYLYGGYNKTYLINVYDVPKPNFDRARQRMVSKNVQGRILKKGAEQLMLFNNVGPWYYEGEKLADQRYNERALPLFLRPMNAIESDRYGHLILGDEFGLL